MRRKFIFLTAAFVLLAFLAVPLGMRGQTRDVETFTFSELGYGNPEAVTTVNGTNVTLTFDQGTNATNAPMYYTNGAGVRMYNGNTLEVALNDQEGETRITAIRVKQESLPLTSLFLAHIRVRCRTGQAAKLRFPLPILPVARLVFK